MQARTIEHLFHGLTFTKTATDIIDAAKKKVNKLKTKIEERQRRIVDLRKEYDIDDGALIQLLTAARKNAGARQYSYSKMLSNSVVGGVSNSSGTVIEEIVIGAGVVNNLLTENDFIEAEKDQASDLELIIRNLKPIPRFAQDSGTELPSEEFVLSKEELKYLGF